MSAAVVLREVRPGAAALKVTEVSIKEQARTFTGLKPGAEYTLEVVAVNTYVRMW
jgi:Fibronectin type III domain